MSCHHLSELVSRRNHRRHQQHKRQPGCDQHHRSATSTSNPIITAAKRLTTAVPAAVPAAARESLGAVAVVVVLLVLLHVLLAVELRRRVGPVAVEHDLDAVKLEARLLPDHGDPDPPPHGGSEDPLGVGGVAGPRETPGLRCLGGGHLVDQPLEVRTDAPRSEDEALDAAELAQLRTEWAAKPGPPPAAVLPVVLVYYPGSSLTLIA